MPPSDTSDRRPGWLAPAAAAALLLLGAVLIDGMYRRHYQAEARAVVTARMDGHARALEIALSRRVVILNALAAWIGEEADDPTSDFAAYARALHALDPGIKALQKVEAGIIRETYPLEGNEAVVGYDLRQHPDSGVRNGLARALADGGVTVTGPVDLLQGGTGFIFRRIAASAPEGLVLSAALVADVAELVQESGLPSEQAAFAVELAVESGGVVFGETLPASMDPVALSVQAPEGVWVLRAAPRAGWGAYIAEDLLPIRLSMAAVMVLGVFLVASLEGRERRLTAAVDRRTHALMLANERLARTADQLRAREEELRAALAAGRVHTWSWDLVTDRITRSFSAQALGDDPGDFPDSPAGILDFVHPDDRDRCALALSEARKDGALHIEYRLADGAGKYHWVRTEGAAVERDEDRPTRIVGATADITRVKRLEADLLHAGRLEMLGTLAGSIAHDFNNLLTVMQAELELAEEEGTPEAYAEAVRQTQTAVAHAAVLTRQMLTFVRKDVVQPEVFHWDTMCAEVAVLVRRLLGDKVDLDIRLDAADARVFMDRSHGTQILTNLAVNARDAMPEGGTLTITTRWVPDGLDEVPDVQGPAVVTEVSDTGCGIPPEVLPHLYEPFFTTKTHGRGTGLGLATVHRIVRDAGGAITLHTSSQGTTFVVVIPTVKQDGASGSKTA